jgi:hypothetical protein
MAIFGKGGRKTPDAEKAGAVSFDPPAQTETSSPVDVLDDDAQTEIVEDVVPASSTTTSAASAAQPATSRFGRRASEKVVKEKVVKVRRVKPGKAAKDAPREVDDYPMPVMMIIEFYEGLKKESEAEQLGRAQIEKNFDAPNASYVYTQKWRNGIAVEVQEGGGEAYLPEILAKLDEDPSAIIAVPMSNRIAQVRLDSETGRLEMLVLLNNQEPPPNAFVPLPSKPMKPFDRRGSRLFISGIAILASTVVASVFSVGAFFIDTHSWALPYVQQTDVKTLPMAQLAEMKKSRDTGDCLFKAEFANGAWKMTAGYNSGGTCVKDRPAGGPTLLPTTPLVPGVPGASGLPAGSTGLVAPPVGTVPGAVPTTQPLPGAMTPGAVQPVAPGAAPGSAPGGTGL